MIKNIKKKMTGIIITGLASILVIPYIITNYLALCEKERLLKEKEEEEEAFQKSISNKYGGPPMPYDRTWLSVLKIHGYLKSGRSNEPVSDYLIKLKRPDLKTFSAEDGSFILEMYNHFYPKFELEVFDKKGYKVAAKNVEFKNEFRDCSIQIDEATVEIIL